MVKFLKGFFYNTTLKFSDTLHVTSNLFLDQVCFIKAQLDYWLASNEWCMSLMVDLMLKKFSKIMEMLIALQEFVHCCLA